MSIEIARDEMMIAAEMLTETQTQYAAGMVGEKALTLAQKDYAEAKSIVVRLTVTD